MTAPAADRSRDLRRLRALLCAGLRACDARRRCNRPDRACALCRPLYVLAADRRPDPARPARSEAGGAVSGATSGPTVLGLRGWPFALLVPAALLIAVALAVFATGIAEFVPPADAPPLPLWALAVALHLIIGSVFAFGEEAGWRGFLLPRLTGLGLAPAMALSGLLHGLWHLPLILLTTLYHADGSRWIVLPEFLLLFVLAGFVYGYLRLATGSLWPAVLLHASFNETLAQTAEVTRAADPALLEYLGAESGLLTIAGTALVVLWIRLAPAARADPRLTPPQRKRARTRVRAPIPSGRSYSAVSSGGFFAGSCGAPAASISSAISPSRTTTRTTPPLASLPNSSSSASGFLIVSWITRPSGRAPIFSS
jgi:uncharacterized protein